MPAPKPSTVADWDTSLLNLLMPSGGQIASGWANNQQVPSDWLNWWMNLVGQWTDYLRDFEIQGHTWSALQTFTAGIDLNSLVTWAPPAYNTGRIALPVAPTGTYVLVDSYTRSVGGTPVSIRLYYHNGGHGDLVVTSNCSWDNAGAQWVADDTAISASKTSITLNAVGGRLAGGGVAYPNPISPQIKETTTVAWSDISWDVGSDIQMVNVSSGSSGTIYQNGWVDHGALPDGAYFGIRGGIVCIGGPVKNPGTPPPNSVIFTLPSYIPWPAIPRLFNCAQGTTMTNKCQVSVDASGNVNALNVAAQLGANEELFLDGISYPVGA